MDKSAVKSDFESKSRQHLSKGSKIPKIPKSDAKAGFKSHSDQNDYSSSSAAVTSKLTKTKKGSNNSVPRLKLIPDLFKESLYENCDTSHQAICNKSKVGFNSKLPTLDSKLKLSKALKAPNSITDGQAGCKKANDQKMQEQVAKVSPIKRTSIAFEVNSEDSGVRVVKGINQKCNMDLINNNRVKRTDKIGDTFENNRLHNISNFWKHTQRSSIGHLVDKYSYSDTECGNKVTKRLEPIQNKCHLIRPNNRGSVSQVNLLLEPLNQRNKGHLLPCPNLKLVNLMDNSSNQLKGNHEVIKLRQELTKARTHIDNLNFKISSNLNTMATFETSLNTLKLKVNQVAKESEQKDRQIECLTRTLENLKKVDSIKEEILCEDDDQQMFSASDHKQPNWFKDQVNRVLKINRRYSRDSEIRSSTLPSHSSSISRSAPSTPRLTVKRFDPFILDVDQLRKQLSDKEKILTDLRLDLLSTENQIEDLREDTTQLSKELNVIRVENEKLQSWLDKGSLHSSNSSVNSSIIEPTAGYSRRIFLSINQTPIRCFTILTTTTWSQLDAIVINEFNQYLDLIDPNFRLGLSENDLSHYEVGEEKIRRNLSFSLNSDKRLEMLPFGYLAQDNLIEAELSSNIAYLVFECNIAQTILSQVIRSIEENRRVALVGPPGTGKSFLAHKVSHFINDHLFIEGAHGQFDQRVDVIDVSAKSAEELEKYFYALSKLNTHSLLPEVIIIEDAHNLSNLDTLSSLIGIPCMELPIIIVTSTESAESTLIEYLCAQLGFVVINWANLMINLETIIERILKRKLIKEEMRSLLDEKPFDVHLPNKIIEWISQVWKKINHILRQSSSNNILIEPFLHCPIDPNQSQLWFINIWKSIIDPALSCNHFNFKIESEFIDWINQTYPWGHENGSLISMLDLNKSKNETDTLLQALSKLKILSQLDEINGDYSYQQPDE